MIDTWTCCRLHGSGCAVAWGYDQAHTDSARPYTLEELADREDGPHYFAYPDTAAYEAAWHAWRALRRDSRLTAEEANAADGVRLARLGFPDGTIEGALEQLGRRQRGW